jgi:hypothetical protein
MLKKRLTAGSFRTFTKYYQPACIMELDWFPSRLAALLPLTAWELVQNEIIHAGFIFLLTLTNNTVT